MSPAQDSPQSETRAPDAASGDGRPPLLVILDSHGIIFRSFFALRDVLTTRRTGEPVAAVFGFANSLLTVLDELKPTHLVAAWDVGDELTLRKARDERYKATRQPIPDELPQQIERVRELLEAFRVPVVGKVGYEADDIAGTLACQAAERGIETVIVTLDNDIVQLVQPHVRVYMYRPYQRDYVMYDEAAVRERWGFEPQQMVDYKALVGDTSDNIPGVRGVGEKGAKALIEQWGSLEAIYDHLDEVTPNRTQKALTEGEDEARLSKELATIVCDVPDVALDLDQCRVEDYDRERVVELFQELEFRSLVRRLPPSDGYRGDGAARTAAPPATAVSGEYEVVTTATRLREVIDAARRAGRVALEVVAEDAHPMRAAHTLVGVGLSSAASTGAYVPFGHRPAEGTQQSLEAEGPPRIDQLSQAEVLDALRPLLEAAEVERVAHDAKRVLLALGEADGGAWARSFAFDTQIAAYLLGDSNMSLDRLAFDRLGLETIDPKTFLGSGRKAVTFAEAPPDAVGRYAAMNADVVLRLADLLSKELADTELDSVFHDIDMPHIPVLARMERFGIALDTGALEELDRDLTERIREAERDVYDAVGHEFQLGSPKELSHVLFEELHLPKTRKTKTGFTTDANALEPLRDAHPAVDALLRWRELTKIESTYVQALPQQVNPRTGRVHTVFSQVTAATGRLSSNDPNLQNIPVRTDIGTEVRRAFVARDCGDDPLLLAIDYSQIELRILAHMSGDEQLRRAFEEHQDIHRTTAATVFRVEPSQVTGEMRRRAKVFNFGVLYGLTAFGLSTREGIPREEADAFITAYFEAFPTVQAWRERIVDEARRRGYAETLTGRRRYIPDLRAPDRNRRMAAERIAINMPIQGTAADIIKIAMNQIDEELERRRERGALARMLLQVHDELIFELPRAELDDVRELAHRLMPSIELAVPLDLEEKWGKSWGDLEAAKVEAAA